MATNDYNCYMLASGEINLLAEENTNFIHNFTYKPSGEACPSLLKGVVRLSVDCSSEVPNEASVSWIKVNESLSIMNVEIFNITRSSKEKDETKFTFQNQDVNYSFNLKVYAKPVNITCQKTKSSNELRIACSIEKIYPAAVCSIPLFTEEQYKVSYSSTQYTVRGIPYFKTECEMTISLPNGTIATNNISVVVYPNVTGSKADIQYGVSNSDIIDVDPNTNRSLPEIPSHPDQQTNEFLYSEATTETKISNGSLTHTTKLTTASVPAPDVISASEMDSVSGQYVDIDKLS
ncbi:hypothetical protein Btru_036713 [Bulinus truncatus]|nr:hypothetical protein Btru_036713 [Bulinus truncatus]